MSEFMSDPVLTLETMEDVRQAMTTERGETCGLKGLDVYRIKSVWLISLIDEIAASGKYPYNATVKQLAEERLGMTARSYAELSRENDSLSTLIYNAQRYRGSDKLKADGFQPFTDELLTEAYLAGKRLEIFSDGLMGSSILPLNVKKIDGQVYAMRPHKRRYHVRPAGQPVRMVA